MSSSRRPCMLCWVTEDVSALLCYVAPGSELCMPATLPHQFLSHVLTMCPNCLAGGTNGPHLTVLPVNPPNIYGATKCWGAPSLNLICGFSMALVGCKVSDDANWHPISCPHSQAKHCVVSTRTRGTYRALQSGLPLPRTPTTCQSSSRTPKQCKGGCHTGTPGGFSLHVWTRGLI